MRWSLLLVALGWSGLAHAAPTPDVELPPLPSGRSLDAPEQIELGDVEARLRLLGENLHELRRFMGRPAPKSPLLRAEGAHLIHAMVQSFHLQQRAQQLGFEHLRTAFEPIRSKDPKPSPDRVLANVDDTLKVVFQVERTLGIEPVRRVGTASVSTDATEVFNAILDAGRLLDVVIDQNRSSSDAFAIVTAVVHDASSLSSRQSRRFLPRMPDFEPNQTHRDVYEGLLTSFERVQRVAERNELPVLKYHVGDLSRGVALEDVLDLAVLLFGEIHLISMRVTGHLAAPQIYYPGRKYPSHVMQRVKLLNAILERLGAARG